MSELEPLDADLAALFATERTAHPAEPLVRDEVLARVERAVQLAVLAQAASGATGGATAGAAAGAGGNLAGMAARAKGVVAVLVATSFGGGVLVGRETAAPDHAETTRAVATASAPVPARAPVEDAGVSPNPAPSDLPAVPPPVAPAPRPVPSAAAQAPPTPSDLAKEQELVDIARVALARGRGADALAATEAHAKRFPRGALSEERDALAVQALAIDGKTDAARARAAQFRRRYPASIFTSAVERAVEPR